MNNEQESYCPHCEGWHKGSCWDIPRDKPITGIDVPSTSGAQQPAPASEPAPQQFLTPRDSDNPMGSEHSRTDGGDTPESLKPTGPANAEAVAKDDGAIQQVAERRGVRCEPAPTAEPNCYCDVPFEVSGGWCPKHSAPDAELSGGVALIAAERRRQIESEGWTPEHDDEHALAELSRAALSYTLLASKQACNPGASMAAPSWWPWHLSWWKPSPDPIRNLAKAGALNAAEIDRLKRAAMHAESEGRS